MAAQYDQLGNYLGDWETEEEREKREQELANRTVLTQEVKTYGDGTVERTTTEEMAPTIQPVAVKPVQQMPVAQPVQQPVSPDTFNRMIQAESRGQNFDAQGRPLTSPKGALFAAQVMPATAAQPGFGVRPAQAQTPEEYNRVGQDYYQAMLQQFGGDEQKAAAAYNAGPGRVQQAQRQAAQTGGSWTDYIPKETMNYLGQVFNKMIPSAQAATLPATQAQQPATITQPAQQPAQTRAQQQMAIVTGQTQQPTSAAGIEAYQQVQDDPMKLLALRNDESAPKWIRERAGTRAFELMDAEIKQKQAAEQVKSLVAAAGAGDRKASNTIARELQNQEGSWLKMLLLGFVSPQLAGEEAVKLGFGNKWTQGYDADGKAALIQVNAKGLPLKGYDAQGKELAAESLPAYMTGGKRNLDIVGGTYVNDKTGEVGRVVTDKNTGQSFVQTETGRKPMTGFRPQSSTGTLADMRTRAIQDLNIKLQGKGVEEQMQILRPYNQMLVQNGFQPVQPAEVGITVPQVGAGTAAPAGPVSPTQAAPTQAAPAAAVTQPAVPGQPSMPAPAPQTTGAGAGVAGRPTAAQMEAAKTGATTAAKELSGAAATEVAKSADTANMIKSIGKSISIIDSGEHNIGPVLSGVAGRGPIAQAIGSQFETKDARNTKTVMDLVNKLASDGLKALGSNPSTVDLEFWTRFKPDASSDPVFVKEWIQSRSEDLQRRVNFARQQLNMEPVFAKDEDRQAYEWTKKNANDPRAAQIRQKLGLQ